MLSGEEGWIVGDRGAILHWDGERWKAVESPINIPLVFVKGVAAEDAWAVGSVRSGEETEWIMLRWDGTKWSIFSNPTPIGRVVAMSFTSNDNGWAIAYKGGARDISYLVHWDGRVWTTIMEASQIYALDMLSENEGWAVGDALYRWDGQSWKKHQVPLRQRGYEYASISFLSQEEGWATLVDGTLLHWNGSEWKQVALNGFVASQVNMITSSNGWLIVGDGTANPKLVHWDGREWKLFEGDQPLLEYARTQMATLPNSDAWMVITSEGRPQIWRWDGTAWRAHKPQELLYLRAFEFIPPMEAWIVGGARHNPDAGNSYIGFWDGKELKQVSSQATGTLNDIVFLTPDNGWAVGGGSQIIHWDGRVWKVVKEFRGRSGGPAQEFRSLEAIAFHNSEDGWAVGGVSNEGGGYPLMFRWDGEEWHDVDPGLLIDLCRCNLTSIGLMGEDMGWVAGGHEGNLFFWNGVYWQAIENPANYWLNSITMLSASDVWVAGYQSGIIGSSLPEDAGIVIHWDGSEWEEVAILPGWLNSIVMLSENDGWIGGIGGLIYHWDGISWRRADTPVQHGIVDIEVSPTGQVWALTESGTLLYFENP